ncbi:MAG: hypothetical protein AB1782_18510 [Cyanobacteriota bacterium]
MIEITSNIINTKYNCHSKKPGNASLYFRGNHQTSDVFLSSTIQNNHKINNNNKINQYNILNLLSFKGKNAPSQETLDYIAKTRQEYFEKYNTEINSLDTFDLNKISDICNGIEVFKDWSSKDLFIATKNIDSILLSKGCSHQCSHCGACAGNKITHMDWDNFVDLANGIGELKNRLGFSPFRDPSFHTANAIYPFNDSDPIHYNVKDSKGIRHNIYDAAKLFYEKTGTKFIITTAGWGKNNDLSQNAAESFAKDPSCMSMLGISIHPFHSFIQRSLKYKKLAEFEKLKKGKDRSKEHEYLQKSQYWRNKYITRMQNVVSFIPKMNKDFDISSIILQYDNNAKKGSGLTKKDAEKLLEEILEIFPHKEREKIRVSLRAIAYLGRAEQYCKDSYNKDARFYTDFDSLRPDDIYRGVKTINTDGKILVCREGPGGLPTKYAELPVKLNFINPTHWRSNNSNYIIPLEKYYKAKNR